MALTWKGLHGRLWEGVRTPERRRAFEGARGEHPALDPFGGAESLVAFFAKEDVSAQGKGQALGVLVGLAQRGAASGLGVRLLWLALWPGLTAVFRRLGRRSTSEEELVSAIAEAFLRQVAGLDLTTTTQIAATLVRSTEREVVQAQMRTRLRDAWIADLAARAAQPTTEGDAPEEYVLSFEYQLHAARTWLQPIAGEDTALVLSVIVFEETQREVGERLGLPHTVVRKRLERVLTRARELFLPPMTISVSPNDGHDALPLLRGELFAEGEDGDQAE